MAEHQADGAKAKRVSLPVVGAGKASTFLEQADLGDELAPDDRAPAAWIGLGAMMTFALMVPLAMAAMALLRAIYAGAEGQRVNPVPLYVLSFAVPAISALGGGFLIGRFGPRVGPKGGALSGLIAGVGMFTIAMVGEVRAGHGALAGLSALVIVLVTAPSSWLGARLGRLGKTRAKS
jgi:hypothetical protein